MQYEEEGDSDKAAVPSDITDTKQQQGRVTGGLDSSRFDTDDKYGRMSK